MRGFLLTILLASSAHAQFGPVPPASSVAGTITVTAAQFSGTGNGTNPLALVSSSVTLQGNTFNAALKLVQLSAIGDLVLSGSGTFAGPVGIGTTLPATGLDVETATINGFYSGNVTAGVRVKGLSNQDSGIVIDAGAASKKAAIYGSTIAASGGADPLETDMVAKITVYDPAIQGMKFGPASHDNTLLIKFASNVVGINNNTPAYSLDVSGVIASTGAVISGTIQIGTPPVVTNTCNSATTCTATCGGSRTLTGGGCSNSTAVGIQGDGPSSTQAWTCTSLLSTNITATAYCGQFAQ